MGESMITADVIKKSWLMIYIYILLIIINVSAIFIEHSHFQKILVGLSTVILIGIAFFVITHLRKQKKI